MKNAFSKSKVGGKKPKVEKKTPEKTEEKIERRKDEPRTAKVEKGCFVRNIMHKCSDGTRAHFKIGDKLDPKHEDFETLKKHLA